METLDNLMNKLSYEMCCYNIVLELMGVQAVKEDINNLLLLLIIDDEVADETLEGILLAELSGLEDEQTLMMKIIDIFNALITAPDSVLRPYQQHFVTEKYFDILFYCLIFI